MFEQVVHMATTVLLRFNDAAGKSGHTAPSLTEGSLNEGGRTLSGLSAAVCPSGVSQRVCRVPNSFCQRSCNI
jgi:hypothetical protein